MHDVFQWFQLLFEELDRMIGRRVRASIKRIAVYPAIALLIAAFMDWWWLAAIATGYSAYQTMRLSLVLAPGAVPLFSIGENTASDATKQWFRGALAIVLGECLIGLTVTWLSVWEDPRAFGVAIIASALLAVHSFVWQSTGKWGQRSIMAFALLALLSSVLAFVEPDIRKATRDAHGKWGKEKAEEIRKDGFWKAFTPAWPGELRAFFGSREKKEKKQDSSSPTTPRPQAPEASTPATTPLPEKHYRAESAIPKIPLPCTMRGGENSIQKVYEDGVRIVDLQIQGEPGCSVTLQRPTDDPDTKLGHSFCFNWKIRGTIPVKATAIYESGSEEGPYIDLPGVDHPIPPGRVVKVRFEALTAEPVTLRFQF